MAKWQQQEKRIAENLSEYGQARETIASGRIWFSKSDVVLKDLLRVEAKTSGEVDKRGNKQIKVLKRWINKVEEEAFNAGRGEIPVLAISFDLAKDYYLIEEYHLNNLIAETEEIYKIYTLIALGTNTKSYTIKENWFDGIMTGRVLPAVKIQFKYDQKIYFIVEDYYFYNLLEEVIEKRGDIVE